jgi:hypothetical protein
LNQVRPDHALQDLHTLNPAARFVQSAEGEPLVLIDAVTTGDPAALRAALVSLGLHHAALFSNDVGGWLPVSQLTAATLRDEVHAIRAAMPRKRTGAVTSQGDYVQHSDVVRSSNSLSGAGITVGVLSDSYDCYALYAEPNSGVPASGATGYASNGFTATAATDISTGDLPSSVNVLEEAEAGASGDGNTCSYDAQFELPFGDEGRAMLQIVHDVAPGAALAFYTGTNSEADFADGIVALANTAGAKVIADDLGYPDEPFFQDGILAQAIDQVEASGVAYFSAAGNDGTLGYDNLAPKFLTAGSGVNAGEYLLNFDTTGATTTTTLPVTIPSMMPGEFVFIVLEWDQPYVTGAPNSGGATSELDLCIANITGIAGTGTVNDVITDDDGNTLSTECSGANALGADPVQVLLVANPADSGGNSEKTTLNVVVGLKSGSAPGRIKLAVEDDGLGSTITQFATNGGTLQGHPGAAGAMAVGAAFYFDTPACGTTPAQLETYSSEGGTPILFDVNGNRLAAPVTRQKPEIVGPDGGNDTFLGFTLESQGISANTTISGCQNDASYPNFFGTSAATPHVAGIAALLLQANSSLTPTEIYTALENGALAMGNTSPNSLSGYGFVQANTSATMIPAVVPAAPTLTLSSSSITVGASTTITWSSANTTGCTASGSWSGSLASSGTQTLTPTAAGTDTYTLVCSNAAGSSASTSVTLTVAAAPSHGGGALGVPALLGLAALRLAGRRKRAR